MLHMITGLPGAGKTLYSLSLIKKFKDEGRPVFQLDIDDMDPDFCSPSPVDIKHWMDLPKNSVLFVDEAHSHFPTRSPGKPPEWIDELTKVRHYGIDIFFITQDPRNFDYFVRRLIGEHIHLSRKMGLPLSRVLTFQGVSEDPQDYHNRKSAVASTFIFPKDLYTKYTSATLHTVKKKVPLKLFILPVLLLAIVALVAFSMSRVHTLKDKPSASASASPASSASPLGAFPADSETTKKQNLSWSTSDEYVKSHTPVLPLLPWSAPLYSGSAPSQIPRLFCIILGSDLAVGDRGRSCRCYTEQATRVAVSPLLCEQAAQDGVYDPYHDLGHINDRGSNVKGQASASPAAPIAPSSPSLSLNVHVDGGATVGASGERGLSIHNNANTLTTAQDRSNLILRTSEGN